MLDLLLEYSENGQGFTHQDIKDEVMTLLFAVSIPFIINKFKIITKILKHWIKPEITK